MSLIFFFAPAVFLLELVLVILIIALLSTDTGVGLRDDEDFFGLFAEDDANAVGVDLLLFDLFVCFVDDPWLERNDGSSMPSGDGNSLNGSTSYDLRFLLSAF